MSQIPQDTIRLTLSDDWVVINDSVKITCNVTALVPSGTTSEQYNTTVRSILNDFIDVTWEFANQHRERATNGFERVMVTATTRIIESENYDLGERANKASKAHAGYEIENIDADVSVPSSKTKDAESDLRVKLIQSARAESDKIAAAMGTNYRVASIEFSNSRYDMMNSRASAKALESFSVSNARAYAADAMGGDVLGNSQKITMSATVTIARFPLGATETVPQGPWG